MTRVTVVERRTLQVHTHIHRHHNLSIPAPPTPVINGGWVLSCYGSVGRSVCESMRPILAGYFTQHVNDVDRGSGVERTFLSGILSPTRSASTQSLQNGVCISKYRCFLSTAISSVRSKPSSFSDEQNSSCAYKQTTLIHAVAVVL